MAITFTVGQWAIPTIITVCLLAWAFWPRPHERTGGWFDGVEMMLRIPVATTGSLVAWLVWALLA